MTFTETVQERGNYGDHRYVITQVDITSLDSAGTEPFDASTRHSLDVVYGSEVLDQENRRYWFDYDADNTNIVVRDRGPEMNQKSVDPDSQTYSGSTETTIATYDAGDESTLFPLNFNPADPTDAGLSIKLNAIYHDGSTSTLVDIGDGTEQTFENLVDGFPTADDGLAIDQLEVAVSNNAGDVTEDIGATTTEFLAWDADAENNEDVGTVTLRLEGDWSA